MKVTMGMPEYLYHYTSIEALGYILKTRKVKFNNLCLMDDMEEATTYDLDYGKYCFVSSWTKQEKETIEMWKMYSNDMSGVRIRLKANPFCDTEVNIHNWTSEKVEQLGYVPAQEKIFLKPVEYIPLGETQKSQKELFEIKDENELLFYGAKLGIYKNDYWEFQKEWRYKFCVVPVDVDCFNAGIDAVSKWFFSAPPLSVQAFYIPIKEDAFNDFEIVLGPKASDMDEEIVNLLVEKYNPNAVVKRSCLTNRIR